MTKQDRVLIHLQSGHTITSLQAIDWFGATRLSAIIYSLKKQGYNISSVMVKVKDRYGATCDVAQYKLIPKNRLF